MALYSGCKADNLLPHGWEHYPLNLADDLLLGVNGQLYNEKLANWAKLMCSASTNIGVMTSNNGLIPTHTRITEETSLVKMLAQNGCEIARSKIISISQEHSFKPFPITEVLLRKTLSYHHVPPVFLDILLGHAAEPLVFEEGYSNTFCHVSRQGPKKFELAYQLKYPERHGRSQELKWSMRQTAVYHRVCVTEKDSQSFCLIFHPKEDSTAEKAILHQAGSYERWKLIETNPLRQNLTILLAYVDNWRDYLTELGELYQRHQTYISAVEFDDDHDFNKTFNFNVMEKLRRLEEKVQSVPVILTTTRSLIDSLVKLNVVFAVEELYDRAERDGIAMALDHIGVRVRGYQSSTQSIRVRLKGLIKLVADTLSLRNQSSAAASQKIAVNHQRIATDISDRVLILTQDSVDDNSVIRLVTLVTMFYLPSSFVASLFGMNLFDFDSQTSNIRIATDFWIYLVVTIPLTALTAAGWWLAADRQKTKRLSRKACSKV
ncbi:uncharacterized protein BDZ99DRAFT_520694 [Mytilinidion resinicola]|uniref:CorA-like transporter domain-containing protein n=1 Tax=Mytilinidion resinicola TaxID=574789 RepID=A0A6A6YLC5_9PEZI|nr:uncharacterized protein BDZ99DRAFT_520694 [Mytilinidion resinicola]KAF2809338.1 hypothetical protein BDZ99DRAFT_520694 [Mytilinidion resinicola]